MYLRSLEGFITAAGQLVLSLVVLSRYAEFRLKSHEFRLVLPFFSALIWFSFKIKFLFFRCAHIIFLPLCTNSEQKILSYHYVQCSSLYLPVYSDKTVDFIKMDIMWNRINYLICLRINLKKFTIHVSFRGILIHSLAQIVHYLTTEDETQRATFENAERPPRWYWGLIQVRIVQCTQPLQDTVLRVLKGL